MNFIHSFPITNGVFLLLFTTLTSEFILKNDKTYSDLDRPNIVIVFVDDMGYGDVGVYNEKSKIPAPHIDGLAHEGIRFMDAHAPGAVCHPSRYGLLKGRYPFRTDTSVSLDEPVIEIGRMTIASLLQTQGYRTAMVGKWHLGYDESRTTDRSGHSQTGANIRAAYRNYDSGQVLPGGPVDYGFYEFWYPRIHRYPSLLLYSGASGSNTAY